MKKKKITDKVLEILTEAREKQYSEKKKGASDHLQKVILRDAVILAISAIREERKK